jgi:hypothetical protein
LLTTKTSTGRLCCLSKLWLCLVLWLLLRPNAGYPGDAGVGKYSTGNEATCYGKSCSILNHG